MHGGEVGHPFPSGCADIDPIGAAWEQPQQIPRDWAKLAARRQAMRGIHALPRRNGGPFLFFASLAMAHSPRRRRTSSFLLCRCSNKEWTAPWLRNSYTYCQRKVVLRCSPLPLVGRCKQQDARDVDETGRDAGAGMMGYGIMGSWKGWWKW